MERENMSKSIVYTAYGEPWVAPLPPKPFLFFPWLVLMLIGMSVPIWLMRDNAAIRTDYVYITRTRVTDADMVHALALAQVAWEDALGHPIHIPDLVTSSVPVCPGSADVIIACADQSAYQIVLVDLRGKNAKTVFMHEIGHLLGASHIEGDPLMKAANDGEVLERPTPWAVAMVKTSESRVASETMRIIPVGKMKWTTRDGLK